VIRRPRPRYDYLRSPEAIYRRSFATVRAEADLSHLPEEARPVAVRMVHAGGDPKLASEIEFHPRLVPAAREALQAGAPIFTDAAMIAAGVTRGRLPKDNAVHCLLHDPRVPGLAREWQTTRAAAAVSLWEDLLDGAVVVIGNAPTALFHLLELIADGSPRPSAVIGIPVGFVGSAQAKLALADNPWDLPYVVVHGRRGGSALCVAALNALAQESEL
jgi:precorrin-8X/cobalt-precorrin-8 methylmutase